MPGCSAPHAHMAQVGGAKERISWSSGAPFPTPGDMAYAEQPSPWSLTWAGYTTGAVRWPSRKEGRNLHQQEGPESDEGRED